MYAILISNTGNYYVSDKQGRQLLCVWCSSGLRVWFAKLFAFALKSCSSGYVRRDLIWNYIVKPTCLFDEHDAA